MTYQPFITNCGRVLLQLGQLCFITNWGKYYYKLGQLSYYKMGQKSLQTGTAITNWDKLYYKLGQLLQIGAIITIWGITSLTRNSVQDRLLFTGQHRCGSKLMLSET